MIMFGVTIMPSKIKELVNGLEEGMVFIFEETAVEAITDGKAFYDDVFEKIIVPFRTYDWSDVSDDEIKAFKSYNKTISRFINANQLVIDALYLAATRSEKRKDIDFKVKKSKYMRLVCMFEKGQKYYKAGLVPIPEALK